MFIFGIGMFGSTFLLPLYLQNSLGYTPSRRSCVPASWTDPGHYRPACRSVLHQDQHEIPIILGAALLTISFYMNSQMSVLTEHAYIMMTLYLRGLAMGMMFAPLTAAATFGIPREKMGQASGLINVIRQVGGSFGVALLATNLTMRVTYHAQVFGEGLQANSPVYSRVVSNLGNFIMHNAGSMAAMARQQGHFLLMANLNKQAFVQAVCDDFLLAAVITMVSAVPVFFLRLKKKKT